MAYTIVLSLYRLYMKASLKLQWSGDITYRRTEIFSTFSNCTASHITSGALQIVDQSSKPVWSMFEEDCNDSVNYRFLKQDVDDNLRVRPKCGPVKPIWPDQAARADCLADLLDR
ncbi:unnamed protein product [Lupinus luteus]|uniref:Uncharacterized protein n=1 Tax=Lupinus luteus TaxID=3873 RepID=A0AAV1WKV1_LUPLU